MPRAQRVRRASSQDPDEVRSSPVPRSMAQEVLRALLASPNAEEIFERAVDLVRSYVKPPAVAVLRADRGARCLRPGSSVGLSPHFRGSYRVRPGDGIEGSAFHLKRPIWATDIREPEGRVAVAEAAGRVLEGEGIRAIVAAPLLRLGEPVGVIAAYHRCARACAGAEVAPVGLIADAASLALDRGEEIERATEQAALTGVRQIVATLCHEINTPLASVLGTVQLLQRRGLASPGDATRPDRPRGDEALAAILAAGQEIADVLRRAQLIDRYRTAEYVGGLRMIDLVA